MSKSTKLVVLGLSVLLASFVVAGGVGVKANTNDDGSYRQLGVYSEVLSRIRTEYVEEPNIPAVTNGALHDCWNRWMPTPAISIPPNTKSTSSARKARPESARRSRSVMVTRM